MMRLFFFGLSLALVGTVHSQCDCPPLSERIDVTISDDGAGTGTTTWTCNNNYILDGYVFVTNGQVLTIEAGTVVKGAAGSGVDAAAMIVSKGGQMFAEGTADCPIIFTHEGDALDGSTPYNLRGQWGGLIILGDATTNFSDSTAAQVEGIPADNNQAQYGGDNDEDNSGTLAYVSIRHGGTQLGAANEINGLTLAGVGSGTTIHHVEVVSNFDDGIEFLADRSLWTMRSSRFAVMTVSIGTKASTEEGPIGWPSKTNPLEKVTAEANSMETTPMTAM